MANILQIEEKEIDQLNIVNKKDKDFRKKNLNLFNSQGFPNKSKEDWKFTDIKKIFNENFNTFSFKNLYKDKISFNKIKDFDHNYIVTINGNLHESNFKFEENEKINIKKCHEDDFLEKESVNSLVCINHALSNSGFYLDIKDNYKFKKVLVIYNIFTKQLNNNFLNIKNKIRVGKNSELHLIDYIDNQSNKKFINNTFENINLNENSVFKSIVLHQSSSNGFFYKYSKSTILSNSNYTNFILNSGLKFSKLDLELDLIGENSECNLKSALFLKDSTHNEIKTKMNHLVPNCKSYQKVKSVLDSNGKGIFQGKIYVKDIAQKTNAYQLSKALLLGEEAEFNSKPELEIYADDVKCSHGSTSGSIDKDSIHYLMTRGLSRKNSIQLLVNGFLNEIIEDIKSLSIRKFVESKMIF